MKRDMDLVRKILLEVEKAEHDLDISRFSYLNENKDVINYHLEMLIERGFIKGKLHKEWGGNVVCGTIEGLTWEGQDFLEVVRDEGVWMRAKQTISKTVGTTSLDVLKNTCTAIATAIIKEHLGIS